VTDTVDERLRRFDERLRGLEEGMSEVMSWKDRADADLYNHGQDGLKTKFTKFMAEHETNEKARKAMEATQREQHRQNRERMNIIIGLLIMLAAYLTLVAPYIKH
jgi:biopolymer transport protein ExbB/TolQ